MSFGNIKCPYHGEHGNVMGGKCAYCLSEGRTINVPIPAGDNNKEAKFLRNQNRVVLAYKEDK